MPDVLHPLPYRVSLLDVDGTLRRTTVPGHPCPNQPGEWELLPHVADVLAVYSQRHGSALGSWRLVSNQGGVGLGYLSWGTAYQLLIEPARAAFALPSSLREDDIGQSIAWCPHAPQARCFCRKPRPFLLMAAVPWDDRGRRTDPLRPEHVLYIGERESDRACAQRAGIPFCWAHEFFAWEGPADA